MLTQANTFTREDVERWLDAQSVNIYLHPMEIVWVRCGECRNRTEIDGQLIATVSRHPTGVWWWFPRHFAFTSPEIHREVFPLSPTGLLADLDDANFEAPMELRCRRHRRPPRSRVWLSSRVTKTWEEGWRVMHV